MTLPDWLPPVIAALGGGSGIALLVRSLRGRAAHTDRESPVPQDRCQERGDRGVTHAELMTILAQHRAEVYDRIQEAEDACERRSQETAAHSAQEAKELAAQLRDVSGLVQSTVGLVNGYISGQAAQSRRGR